MFGRWSKPAAESHHTESDGGEPPQYSTRGQYGLKCCHESEGAVADIVFVHGLTGNRETTWTEAQTGVFWPAQLLKTDVPRSRILTYGYDADVTHFWAMASNNRIGNHANNLVNALAQLRERTGTEDRPIVFVTHSLGGLVFEDVLLSSKNSAEPHIQSLLDKTIGVCFLGTPHCGSDLANWASIFGNVASLVRATNTNLLNVLKPESEVLARIQQEFHTMLRARNNIGFPPLKVTCFYEELPVRGIGEVVPKHSAILPAYNAIGIRANHMDMTKFSSAEDPGYLAVSTEISRWVKSAAPAARQPSPYHSFTALEQYGDRQQEPPPRQDYYQEQGPTSRHSPWPQQSPPPPQQNYHQPPQQNYHQPPQQQQRQIEAQPHLGQLAPWQGGYSAPPQHQSPPAQYQHRSQSYGYPPQPRSSSPYQPRDPYAPQPYPPYQQTQYVGEQRYGDHSQYSTYYDGLRAEAPAPRILHQGANEINVANQTTSHGGKTVQGMNINSEKDVTFNF